MWTPHLPQCCTDLLDNSLDTAGGGKEAAAAEEEEHHQEAHCQGQDSGGARQGQCQCHNVTMSQCYMSQCLYRSNFTMHIGRQGDHE